MPKNLKTNYIKNTILEIESDKVVDSMEILEKEDWVGETSIFGNYIHIILNDNSKGEKDIKDVLTNKHSIAVHRVDKIIPTLEDVFIHLLEKDNKQMFHRILAIAKKEYRQLKRDTRMLFIVFFFPVVLLAIFGYAINFDVKHIKIAVYDQDKSDYTREYINGLISSEYFDLVKYVSDDE